MVDRPAAIREAYNANYYGMGEGAPTANYRNYGPGGRPGWAKPLASLIVQALPLPVLDVGCAYGHLVREINTLKRPTRIHGGGLGVSAWGIEWSDWAARNKVTDQYTHADARTLGLIFDGPVFGTILSMDFLEHFPPAESIQMIGRMFNVLRPGGYFAHLIGSYDPATDYSQHRSDPTHVNDEPQEWYEGQFVALGMVKDDRRSTAFNEHPGWRGTDWNGRWAIFKRGGLE